MKVPVFFVKDNERRPQNRRCFKLDGIDRVLALLTEKNFVVDYEIDNYSRKIVIVPNVPSTKKLTTFDGMPKYDALVKQLASMNDEDWLLATEMLSDVSHVINRRFLIDDDGVPDSYWITANYHGEGKKFNPRMGVSVDFEETVVDVF